MEKIDTAVENGNSKEIGSTYYLPKSEQDSFALNSYEELNEKSRILNSFKETEYECRTLDLLADQHAEDKQESCALNCIAEGKKSCAVNLSIQLYKESSTGNTSTKVAQHLCVVNSSTLSDDKASKVNTSNELHEKPCTVNSSSQLDKKIYDVNSSTESCVVNSCFKMYEDTFCGNFSTELYQKSCSVNSSSLLHEKSCDVNSFIELVEKPFVMNSSSLLQEESCIVNSAIEFDEKPNAVNLFTELNSSTEVDEESCSLNCSTTQDQPSLNSSTDLSDESNISNLLSELNLSSSIEIITSEDELREIFSNCSCQFNIIHINAQSIYAHYLTMLATFATIHNIDAILVSETFLKEKMDSDLVALPGYKLIRNDRENTIAGGVAIYLREEIMFTIVGKSPTMDIMCAEYLFIELFHEETKLLLGVFYSPSLKLEYFPTFEMLLIKYRSQYKYVNIMGDFNTNVLKNGNRLKKLLSITDHHKLRILPLGPTHFAPGSLPSLLDLIIVSELDEVVKHGQIDGYFSYHDIIYLSCKLPSWRKRASTSNSVVLKQTNEIQPFWQKKRVRQALAQQLIGLKKYKVSKRDKNDLKDYQISRKPIKLLEIEFKRVTSGTAKPKKLRNVLKN